MLRGCRLLLCLNGFMAAIRTGRKGMSANHVERVHAQMGQTVVDSRTKALAVICREMVFVPGE